MLGEARTHRQISEVEHLAQVSTTPLRRWEDSLELPVALLVLPVFAFLNAGILVTDDALRTVFSEPVALGIVFGLVVGKPLGIFGSVWLVERLGAAARPAELTAWRLLAGVGFTMSTFIANLALGAGTQVLATAKLAIVLASALAALAGYLCLRLAPAGEA